MKRPLAILIRKAIRASKVSPATVAKTAGISIPTVYSVMNGRTPSKQVFDKLCSVLTLDSANAAIHFERQRADDLRSRSAGKVKVAREVMPKDERALLTRYRALPKAHKRIVMGMLGLISRKKPPQ